MTVQQYNLMAGDWLGLEHIINDLATRVVGQLVSPISSPTFAGGTITNNLAVGGDLSVTGDLSLTGGLEIAGVLDLTGKLTAGSFGSPIDVTATRQYGFEIHYSGNDYNVTGIRSRASLITTGTSAFAQGALLQAANSDGIDAGVLNGAVIEAIGKSSTTSATISTMRGLLVGAEWDDYDTVTSLQTLHVRTHTRNAAGEGSFGDGYGLYIENEAVGGNGQALDAGIYFKGTNLSAGNKAFTYGIDFSGGTYGTAEIRFSNGETIDNLIDGQLDITGDLVVSGTLTAEQITSTDDISASDKISAGGDIIAQGGVQGDVVRSETHLLLKDTGTFEFLGIRALENAYNADKFLDIDLSNDNRTLIITGDPTLADWFDQNVKKAGIPTFSTVTIGSATGVKLSAVIGELQLAGIGGSNNESLLLDFEGTANTVVFTSTGVTKLDFSSFDLDTTGIGTVEELIVNHATTVSDVAATIKNTSGDYKWEFANAGNPTNRIILNGYNEDGTKMFSLDPGVSAGGAAFVFDNMRLVGDDGTDNIQIVNTTLNKDIQFIANVGGSSKKVMMIDGSVGWVSIGDWSFPARGMLSVNTAVTTTVGIIVRGEPAQTANLQQWRNNAEAVLSAVDASGNLHLKSNNELRFYDNGNYVGFEAPALSADQIWVLPTADGLSGEVLTTDGSGALSWTSNASEKTWAFMSRDAATGVNYIAGYYKFETSDNDFNPAVTFGTANASYAAHFFLVQAAGASGGTDTVIRVTGTSINDQGTRTAADTEDLTVDDAGAAGTYYETTKKWLGQISIEKQSGPDLLCNYGFCKYWDNNNTAFKIVGIEATWLGAKNDATPDIKLRHHKAAGWTYNNAAAPTPPAEIAGMVTDHNTEIQIKTDEEGAWKRDNLSTNIAGNGSEGIIIELTTTTNRTYAIGNFLIRITPQ